METGTTATIAGECRVFLAFEAGYAVDLERAATRFPASAREALPPSRRLPADSDFSQKPLRVAVARAPIALGAWSTAADVEATVYDFGAVSVAFRIAFAGSLESLRPLAAALWNNAVLAAEARAVVEQLLATLGDAVVRPELRAGAEDYVVFTVDPASCGAVSVDALGATSLAALLRLEDGPLSAESAADAVSQALSYAPRDLVLVDWAAALVVDAEPAATLAVLELANVQLVELKHLDAELDRGLDQVWARVSDRSLFSRLRLRGNLRRLAELELEGAALFDSVVNALKLFGDQHLARVQRSAARRFRIDDWEQSVSRKLATLGSISERLEARQSQYRSELLEWIIIALIAFEIVQALW
ncbi:MAG: hypothetical protein ACKOYN_10790 [Planctomycetota bacterium]